MNTGQIMAQVWEEVMRDTPSSFNDYLFEIYADGAKLSYRDRLHRPLFNFYGEVIPRIRIVRRNLRLLGNIRLDPNRIP